MTKDLIYRVYRFDTHRSSDKPNSIGTTTLIGLNYKAKLALEKTKEDPSFIDDTLKRSSTLGTAFHERAELALKDDPKYIQELYRERTVEVRGTTYTISGSCDLLEKQDDGSWIIADWKTYYGKEFSGLDSAKKQLSIYRWLLQSEYDIEDTGFILSLSVTMNGKEEAHPLSLMSLEDTQLYIESKLEIILDTELADCGETKYNSCNYCDFICQHRQ